MTAMLGQGEDFARQVRAARAGRMHHGMLISGVRGAGKTAAALELARALLCPGDDPDQPCGGCRVCAHVEVHPDLHRVELPEDRDEIPVDLVRELRESLARRPVEGRARVVLIDPADRLNVQGQNALLKTLEEPGRATWLLLPTTRPEALLPTVRSRVAALRILPLDDATLARRLAALVPGVGEVHLQRTVELAGGSLGQGLLLLSEENRPILELLEAAMAGTSTPVTVARAALHGVSGRIPTLERARTALWMLRTLLRKELWNALATEDTAPYSAATSVRWTAALESLVDADEDLSRRIPPEQVLTAALFRVLPQSA